MEALNELYDQPDGWWRRLLDDEELFLAVRDDYVNIYYLGCSLLNRCWGNIRFSRCRARSPNSSFLLMCTRCACGM